MLGLKPQLPLVGPEILRGIEINTMAAELARTTIWIGDIQWQLRNGIRSKSIPILRKLEAIEQRDALVKHLHLDEREPSSEDDLLASDASQQEVSEAEWPEAEFVVGNPPFLGIRLMRYGLGDEAVERLFNVYDGRVSREADLVCYWFEKARASLKSNRTQRVGLVATNSIRGGANRKVLDQIAAESRIFEAWSDEPWIVDGAAVRVSLICFGKGDDALRLDGQAAAQINSDLTAGAVDLTRARRLAENLNVAFMGDTKGGAFDVPGQLAREWLRLPLNPNGRPNLDVLRPWRNGMDVTRRARDMWIVDFGWEMTEQEASLYEAPFQYLLEHVLPERTQNRREAYRERWWRHVEPRPGMWASLSDGPRYIATPTVAKYRLFVWSERQICPDHQLIAIVRDDDTTLGILHSRFHKAWSLRLGTSLEDRPRYTPTSAFETYPFPEGLTPNIPAKHYRSDPRAATIVRSAKHLDDLRNAWLNPPDLIRIEPEVVPGYPDRIVPKDTASEALLRERTLTNLYNRSPQWLLDAHRELDAAVAAAYGWPADISDEDALANLLELNLARAAVDVAAKSPPKTVRRKSRKDRAQTELLLPIKGGKPKKAQDELPFGEAAKRAEPTTTRPNGRRRIG